MQIKQGLALSLLLLSACSGASPEDGAQSESAAALATTPHSQDTWYAVPGYNPIAPYTNNTLFVMTSRVDLSFYTAPFYAINNGGNFLGGYGVVKQSDYVDIYGNPLPLSWTTNEFNTYIAIQVCGSYGLHVATIPDLAYQTTNSLFGQLNQYRLDEFLINTPSAVGANGQLTAFGISLIPQGTVNTEVTSVLFDDGLKVFGVLPQISGLFLGTPAQFGSAAQPEAYLGAESGGVITGSNCTNPPGSFGGGCINDPPSFGGTLVCSN